MTYRKFFELLNEEPFSIAEKCKKIDLEKVIEYANPKLLYQETFGTYRDIMVDIKSWIFNLETEMKRLTKRAKELLNIRKGLDERGMTIEGAIREIKGNSDRLENQGISVQDFVELCLMTEVRLDPETQIIPIIETFD